MRHCFRLPFLLAALALAPGALAKTNVVTTLPDLAWVVEKIGGDRVTARSLMKGIENPHYVDAVPEFIRRVADADVVVLVGLDLEVGWLPKVLSRSGNAKVQSGGPGYCDASRTVQVRERPSTPVDRSMGDIHPQGNSHYWLGPTALGEAAATVADCLAAVDPEGAERYRAGAKTLAAELTRLRDGLRALLPKTAPPVLEYHREFSYFFADYGLQSAGTLEEKPGLAPSAGRIATVATLAKRRKVALLVAGLWAPKAHLDRFTELSGIPAVALPISSRPGTEYADYPRWQRYLVTTLATHLAPPKEGGGR
jgi:zinc/manganese transport system substrate-binding protein